MVRLQIKYLSFGPQKVKSNGQSLTIPGVEDNLRKALLQRLEDETEIPAMRPQIIANLLSNTLILEGTKSHVEWLEKLVQLWDRPLTLIRIEAYLFETSETHSQQLGLEFRVKKFFQRRNCKPHRSRSFFCRFGFRSCNSITGYAGGCCLKVATECR
jgi:type II secretory pathway component GspD/PulD (secretin)